MPRLSNEVGASRLWAVMAAVLTASLIAVGIFNLADSRWFAALCLAGAAVSAAYTGTLFRMTRRIRTQSRRLD